MQTSDRPARPAILVAGAARPAAALALAVVAALGVLLTAARAQTDDKAILKLIDQLGDDELDTRKAAEKKLTEIGEAAVPHLRTAARSHPDADVRLRSLLLGRVIQKVLFGEIRKFVGHTGNIRHIAVSKDGKRALTAGMDYTVRLWDLDTGKELLNMTGHTSWAWQVAFTPDERQAVSSGSMDKTLRLWNLQDGKEVRQFVGHNSRVYGAAISPDGKYVLSGGADADRTMRLYETETGKEVRQFAGHPDGWVWKVQFSPDGKKAASVGCNDYSYRIWDVETGNCLVKGDKAHGGWVVSVAFSPDGKHLLTAGRDLTVKLWEVDSGKLVRTYTGVRDNVEAVAFSKDGKRFLAGGKDKAVHVFETDTGKIIHRFEDFHTDEVLAVAFLPDGRRALSAGADNTMRMWNVPR